MTLAKDRTQTTVLTESQEAVLQKYKLPHEKTWEDVCDRVARFVASAELTEELQNYWREQFLSILVPMKFVPAGSILANSDHGTRGMNNCFVLSSEDNIQDIMKLVYDAVLTTKFRGGVGINIGSEGMPGYIRPKGYPFKDGQALGPCAVLDMVSECSKKITTGNKARRGAFMFSMHWKHPDIWEFIQAKTQSVVDAELLKKSVKGQLSQEEFDKAWVESHLSPEGKRDRRWHNANISVQVDDEFFELLDTYDAIDSESIKTLPPETIKLAGEVKRLWNAIAECAHATADPGLILWSNMKRSSPIKDFILTTNPCGEQPLPKDSSCNLGSIVLSKFAEDGKVDWKDLARTTSIAVRFLDNVLDVSEYATPEQKESIQNKFRQVGLGVMGAADLLKQLQIEYDSESHLSLIDDLGEAIANTAYRTSEVLVEEKGACGIWEQIKGVKTGNAFERWYAADGTYIADGDEVEFTFCKDPHQMPRRNATVLSIAPTGSIAQLAGCSWAFEPDFGLTIWKQVFVDASKSQQQWVQILNPYLESLGLNESDRAIVMQTGSLQGTEFAQQNPEVAAAYKIAREITPEWHIKVQAQWQKWIDSSISKTINLPKEATVEDIKQAYRMAQRSGLKGVTVYRAGTLDSEPIKVGNSEARQDDDYKSGCKSGSCDL